MPEGRVIAVTGASRGIGAHTAAELARRGHTVGCLSRKGLGIEEFVVPEELAARMVSIPCDVTDAAARQDALAELVAEAGRLDGLVNNAGQHAEGPSESFAVTEFDRLLSTNATSVFAMSQAAYPYLRGAGGGIIVSIGSYYDKMGVRHHAAYAASKAAIAAVARCLAVEWAKDGIRVVTVAPGFIATDLNKRHRQSESFNRYIASRVPTGDAGTPAEVARLVAAVFDANLDFLNGETIYLDGGQSIAN
jgi:NAD(P)-dependent dehydrogenase (short-subunit alcohol dehydrogenase family)